MPRALLLALALTACTQFPELDQVTSGAAQDADFPALVPVGPLLAQTARPGAAPEILRGSVEARAAALRARAARLRGRPVIDRATRIRMGSASG
ncbi:MAG: hypothetical protein AAGF60_04635 [Pseudomonadota bacterium]